VVCRDGERRELEPGGVVLATGARERFLPLPGWTRPGVFGVGGLQALSKQGFDVAGCRVLVAGSGPLMLAVAAHLRGRGARVVAVVEQAPRARVYGFAGALVGRPRKLAQAMQLQAKLASVPKAFGDWPVRIDEGLVVTTRVGRRFEVDLVALGFGLVPETRIARYLGCAVDPATGTVVVDETQQTSVAGVRVAGEPAGIGGVDKALLEGEAAGLAAGGAIDKARALLPRIRRERRWVDALERTFALAPALRSLPDEDTIVCRCEDVTWGRIAGEATMRGIKLQTRCGMGACQARVCGPALEFLTGLEAERIRPPFVPVDLEMLAR
jgi:NADPH-dependent 2,4-dienoyl-CoA reductase/sulfur reductase-like enzyme